MASFYTVNVNKESNHVCWQSCGDGFRRGQTEQEIGQLLLKSTFLSDIAGIKLLLSTLCKWI